jgi:hypothetical protein
MHVERRLSLLTALDQMFPRVRREGGFQALPRASRVSARDRPLTHSSTTRRMAPAELRAEVAHSCS